MQKTLDKYIIVDQKTSIDEIIRQKQFNVNPNLEMTVKSVDEEGVNSLRVNVEKIHEIRPGYYRFDAFLTTGLFIKEYYYPEVSEVTCYLSKDANATCFIQISTISRVSRYFAPVPRNRGMQAERDRALEREYMLYLKWKNISLKVAN